MTARAFLIVSLALLCFRCTVTNASTPNASADAGAMTMTGGALSCGAILDCIVACPDTDQACPDACGDKGTAPAKDAVVALATCVNANSCSDSACVQQKCTPELETCVKTGGSMGAPIQGTPPQGSVPSDLVGKWYSFGVLYEFSAQGTMRRDRRISTGGCVTKSGESGSAVVDGSALTLYFTSGVFDFCGKSSKDPYQATAETYTYKVETSGTSRVLRLIKSPCEYTEQALIDARCTDGFDYKP
jgi:hypothetical protein